MMDRVRNMSFVPAIHAAGGEVFFVGGCVRDSFMNRPSKDVDLLVRGLPIESLEALLAQHGDVDLVGKSFAVLKFVPLGERDVIDIALPRFDSYSSPAHRNVEVRHDHTAKVEDDLARRDFTINAVALPLARPGEIVDPFNGLRDLRCRLVRMVYPNSFKDDALRMLRAIQFAARFNFTLEENTFRAMQEEAPKIRWVSGERVAEELLKVLRAPKPSVGFRLMRDVGLLQHVLPEVHALIGVEQPRKHHSLDAFDHVMTVVDAARADRELENPGDVNLMLAALFHDLGKPPTYTNEGGGNIHFHGHQHVSEALTKKVLKRIPFHAVDPKVDPQRVLRDVKMHMDLATHPEERDKMTDRALRRLIVRAGGPDGMRGLIDLRLADKRGGVNPNNVGWILEFRRFVDNFVNREEPFSLKQLAVNGSDVMEILGIPPSKKVGEVLNALFEKVVDGDLPNDRAVLAEAVKQFV